MLDFNQPGPSHKSDSTPVEINPEVKEIIKDLPPLLFGIYYNNLSRIICYIFRIYDFAR